MRRLIRRETYTLSLKAARSSTPPIFLKADRSGTGDDLCARSPTVTAELKTASGLGLGMTRSQVESILGKPTASKGDKLVYFRQVKEKNSPEILRRLRREHPDISNEEFHRDYDFSDLTVYIEVSSPARRSTALGLSMSETM